ncbi:IclR family transcriptional regulator [Holophaga foetida]|uniref:IclR family transcriptional regulator n=1 Tax=Holophaga foetida TaxID=35839 RepID=UPI0002472EA6|nr:IclR family transcriptional regulator [Holophaga foetida]
MTDPEEKPSTSIQALNRAVDVLHLLHDHPNGLPIRRLASLAKLAPSTTQRILRSLEEANLVLGSPKGYRLGPTLTRLARSVRPFDIVNMVHPTLLQLASSTGETASLAILSHGKAIVVDQARGKHPLMATASVGSSLPLHGSACGKALLAAMPPQDLEPYQTRLALAPLTHRTIVEWPILLPELETVRERGLAFDHQEHTLGICSIAASLPMQGAVLAALSVPIPTRRYKDVEAQVCEALKDCRQSLLRRLQDHSRNPLDGWVFPGKAATWG